MRREAGLAVDCRAPLQDTNCIPDPGVAVRVTEVPEANQDPAGLGETVPVPEGAAAVVRRYSVIQVQVRVELLVRVTVTLVEEPVAGTSPVPVQPVHTYRVPAGPFTGEVTEQGTCVPAK
jgi:hypothetical protein